VNERRAMWLVVLGALAVRAVLLAARGDYLVYDEGYYLLLSRSLAAGHGYTLNGLPHVALSPLQPVLVALLSIVGVPDLLASRLLAAVCGSLLVVPVWSLARRAGGSRAAFAAALLTAVSPALMSFVPFFPGRSWNLYFGSEPLFLLAAFGATATVARAVEGGRPWWLLAGALAGAAYLARAEGLVLGPVLFASAAALLAVRRAGAAAWTRLALGIGVAVLVASPYLLYLHGALGRWAVSGRVQAAVAGAGGAAVPSAVESARSGGSVLDAFVWQGRPDAFVKAMYGLDAGGTRMASQYWGVHREAATAPAAAVPAAVPPDSAAAGPSAPSQGRGRLAVWWQAVTAVVPWWLGVVALAGLACGARPTLVWVLPLAVCAVVPSLLVYVEPRSLLPLAPMAALYAGVAVAWLNGRLERRWPRWPRGILVGAVALALLAPAVRDLLQSWKQQTPLQQVATAQRTVGEYLSRHLPPGASVMSFHPAVAIWAGRPWRVLPDDSFERIVAYARAVRASAVVFSTFGPSPIAHPPRAFTIILPGSGSSAAMAAGSTVQLVPVEKTPLLFVGRLAEPGGAP